MVHAFFGGDGRLVTRAASDPDASGLARDPGLAGLARAGLGGADAGPAAGRRGWPSEVRLVGGRPALDPTPGQEAARAAAAEGASLAERLADAEAALAELAGMLDALAGG